jgi:hypothetical protein
MTDQAASDKASEALAGLLAQALDDPRLSHLDAHARLEMQLADALHHNPDGRAALFDAAAQCFGWTEGRSLPGSARTGQWISCVMNQQLHWEAQIAVHRNWWQNALTSARSTGAATQQEVRRLMPALLELQKHLPDWLTLQLPPGHLAQWTSAWEMLPPVPEDRTQRPRTTALGRAVSIGFPTGLVLMAVSLGVLSGFVSKPQPYTAPTYSESMSTQTVEAITFGPITAENCKVIDGFLHQSNWLETYDADSIDTIASILANRILLCQDRQLWPQAEDPLVACLRKERGAASTDARWENYRSCLGAIEEKP